MKIVWVFIFCMISSLLVSCLNDDDDCNFKIIPLQDTRYRVAAAGSSNCDGEYYIDPIIYNEKKVFIYYNRDLNKNFILLYDIFLGWSIAEGGINGPIFYYSNIHTDEPPGDGSTVWQTLTGIDPAPTVVAETYYYPQLIGNCL
jgi:hypothetical protein